MRGGGRNKRREEKKVKDYWYEALRVHKSGANGCENVRSTKKC